MCSLEAANSLSNTYYHLIKYHRKNNKIPTVERKSTTNRRTVEDRIIKKRSAMMDELKKRDSDSLFKHLTCESNLE